MKLGIRPYHCVGAQDLGRRLQRALSGHLTVSVRIRPRTAFMVSYTFRR